MKRRAAVFLVLLSAPWCAGQEGDTKPAKLILRDRFPHADVKEEEAFLQHQASFFRVNDLALRLIAGSPEGKKEFEKRGVKEAVEWVRKHLRVEVDAKKRIIVLSLEKDSVPSGPLLRMLGDSYMEATWEHVANTLRLKAKSSERIRELTLQQLESVLRIHPWTMREQQRLENILDDLDQLEAVISDSAKKLAVGARVVLLNGK